jgi:hypothetical protein
MEGRMSADIISVRNVLGTNCDQLLGKANVVATGIGYKTTEGKKTDDISLICSVKEKLPRASLSLQDMVPAKINGISTDIVETGIIRVRQLRTEKHRPAPGGVSIGHRNITAGTLGCLVKKNGQTYILSNNHVLANSNDAQPGDAILQPGPHDGGRYPDDHIATLAEFVPISLGDQPSECPTASGIVDFMNKIGELIKSDTRMKAVSAQADDNLVDAAIALPLNDQDVSAEILEVGTVNAQATGVLGMAIKKSGRTTGLTSGEILQVDVTVNVQYGAGRIARFTNQLLAGAMSQGGDSGSAVLDENNNLVGLLFAGSDTSTIINRIENVFSALGLTL